MKKLIFVILLASSLLLSGCYDIGFGHNNNKHRGGDISQTYELQADGSWKGTEDGTILKGTNAAYIAELDKAPSAGGQPSNVKSISSNYEYTNTSGAAKMVIIRTTGGDLTINAPLDTVLHYGEAGTVNVIAVASSSYDGYAAITQKLVAKAGHIKLFDIIAAAIPLIEVPADATGAVAVDIPEDVVVEAVTVASAQATSIKIEGSVNTVTDTGAGTTTVEVKETGIVDKTDGVTATGDGYVADNNGTGEMGEKPDKWDGNTYKVFTASGLKEIATTVNGGDNLSGKTVQLQRDLSLMDEEWTPIGSKSADKPFSGTFDGNGKTISGLKITSGDYVALFGKITGATVKDFTIIGTITGSKNAAGVVGRMDGGTISNVVNKVNVTDLANVNNGKAGGVAVLATAGTIDNCINEGTVTSKVNSNEQSGIFGGILAYCSTGEITIKNCINKGAIDTIGQYVGGISGDNETATNLTIENCKNIAAVTGKKYVGGIIGADQQPGIVKACENSGSITSTVAGMSAGGIAGVTGGAITFKDCINSGSVSADIAGGLIGKLGGAGTVDGGNGGTAALTGTYVGRLVGCAYNQNYDEGYGQEASFKIGTKGVGEASGEKTIGSISGGDDVPIVYVTSGTLYGDPESTARASWLIFSAGTKWNGKNGGNAFAAKTKFIGVADTTTWNQQ